MLHMKLVKILSQEGWTHMKLFYPEKKLSTYIHVIQNAGIKDSRG